MRKRRNILAGGLILCCLLLLTVPAAAADNNPGGLTLAAALDSSGETVGAVIAVAARYTEGIYVEAPASLVSSQAASYEVYIDGKFYPMQFDSAWDDLGIAEFTVSDPGNSLGVPGTGAASQGEQASLVYYYSGSDGLAVATSKIQITDYRESNSGVVLYDFEQLESLESDFRFPMSVINGSGQVIAYVSQTGSGVALYTYVFDAAGFSGGGAAPAPTSAPQPTAQPTAQPAPQPTAAPGPEPGGNTGRDPVIEEKTDIMPYVAGGGAVVVVGAALVFLARKKKGGASAGGGTAGSGAPANVYYQPAAPVEMPPTAPAETPPTAPADIPPTAPSPVAAVPPTAPKKVSPVVYGMGGEMDGRRYVLTQPTLTIGREKSCHICYSAATPGISHQHCVLAMRNGVLMLMDNGSTYGTYLRGTGKLTPQQPVALKDGDVFYLGEKKNAFRLSFE